MSNQLEKIKELIDRSHRSPFGWCEKAIAKQHEKGKSQPANALQLSRKQFRRNGYVRGTSCTNFGRKKALPGNV
jgi:hypothetical protein